MENKNELFLTILDILSTSEGRKNTSHFVGKLQYKGKELDIQQTNAVLVKMSEVGYVRLQSSLPALSDKDNITVLNVTYKGHWFRIDGIADGEGGQSSTTNNHLYGPFIDSNLGFGDDYQQTTQQGISSHERKNSLENLKPSLASSSANTSSENQISFTKENMQNRAYEICEIGAEYYEQAIRAKLKDQNLTDDEFGPDLITSVRLYDEQIEYRGIVDNGIRKDENGNIVSLQSWLSIFTNRKPRWWIGTFQEIAIEATMNFQHWVAAQQLEPEFRDFCKIDERGRVYKTVDITSRVNEYRYEEDNPLTGEKIDCPVRGWQYDKYDLARKIYEGDAQYVGATIEGRNFLKEAMI